MPVGHQQTELWTSALRAVDLRTWRERVAGTVQAIGGDAEAVDTARLVAHELLVNVLRHVPYPGCRLAVGRVGGGVRVGVHDRSPVAPQVTVVPWTAERGRGLWVLRQQERTRDWGWVMGPDGKEVWFLVGLTGRPGR